MKHPAALCALPLVLLAVAPAIGAPEEITEYLPFREIDLGEISSYLRQHESFSGSELHITDPGSWGEFWAIHTFHQTPKPPLPEVRFPQENVIVVLLGLQTTGGGPSIGVSEIMRGGQEYTDHRPGGPDSRSSRRDHQPLPDHRDSQPGEVDRLRALRCRRQALPGSLGLPITGPSVQPGGSHVSVTRHRPVHLPSAWFSLPRDLHAGLRMRRDDLRQPLRPRVRGSHLPPPRRVRLRPGSARGRGEGVPARSSRSSPGPDYPTNALPDSDLALSGERTQVIAKRTSSLCEGRLSFLFRCSR